VCLIVRASEFEPSSFVAEVCVGGVVRAARFEPDAIAYRPKFSVIHVLCVNESKLSFAKSDKIPRLF
jgi:hypothetical protein